MLRGIQKHQESNSWYERAEEQRGHNNDERCVQQRDRDALQETARGRRIYRSRGGDTLGRRARPRLARRDPRSAWQKREVFQARTIFHNRIFTHYRTRPDEAPAAYRDRADDQLPVLDGLTEQCCVVVDAGSVTNRS